MPEATDTWLDRQHFHVPGCGCEIHDAPFLNVRDDRCVEWTAIQQRALSQRLAAPVALAAAVEQVRATLDAWDRLTKGPSPTTRAIRDLLPASRPLSAYPPVVLDHMERTTDDPAALQQIHRERDGGAR